MTIISGVEEAGRGPVIGPMVMAIVTIDKEEEVKLANIGVKDSKLLTPVRREFLFDKIKDIAKEHKIIVLSPEDVDMALGAEDMNLNLLEAKTSAELIDSVNIDEVILDCPSNNISAYTASVLGFIQKNKQVKIVSEHKADLNHIVVGAASILAKVTRDRLIEDIKKNIGIDFGSGYPSDPKTIKFLEDNWSKYKGIFRKSWSSYKRHENKAKQKGLSDF